MKQLDMFDLMYKDFKFDTSRPIRLFEALEEQIEYDAKMFEADRLVQEMEFNK